MNHLDLLLLSFVSKNMKKLIMSSQKKASKSIKSIDYQYRRTDGTCAVYLLDEIKPLEEYYPRPSRTDDDMIMKIVERDEDENGKVQFNVLGNLIDFRFDGEYKYPVVSYQECDKESVFPLIHNHFLDIFGNSIEYHWVEQFWRYPEDLFIPFIPKLKNVSFNIGMNLDGHFSDVRNFKNFFSSSPVMKTIHLEVKTKMKQLGPGSKFYQAEYVYINTPRINGPNFLRHFRGKQIGINCNEYRTSKLIDFVNRWKSGEAFQNLEYVEINIGKVNRSLYTVLNEIGAKFIDAHRQPPAHTVYSLFNWGNKYRTFPLTSHRYIVRETDNRVAYVDVMLGYFLFGVWDKTEEEFLRMLE
ncbi:hypothetical protein B9Z55_000772 [Caenorhabditis nigoni]|nr:hypothetical protein B9Z55_000772 [Caenorhabditis nigoni]